MDSELEQKASDLVDLGRNVAALYEETTTKPMSDAPDWGVLQYSKRGVSDLFDEFKKVAAFADYLLEKIIEIELSRSTIVCWLNMLQVRLDRKVDEEHKKQLSVWVGKGYAQTERRMLASMIVGDDVYELRKARIVLERVDATIVAIKTRHKEMISFKFDVKVVKDFLNFGNIIGELP